MHLKGCLHTHTTCSDGKMTPQEVADVYGALGYDFIAFTDHDYLARPDRQQIYDRVSTPMLVLHGIELTVFERGYLHVNRIEGQTEVLHVLNHPAAYDLDIEELRARMTELGKRMAIDAVEASDQGFRSAAFDVAEIGLPRIASDDSHERLGCGRAWIELDTARDPDAILRAVKAGDFWNCWARGNPTEVKP